MARSSGKALFANFSTYDAPFPTKVRLALSGPDPAVAGTTASRAADGRPRGPVRVPTTTDTRTTTASTADVLRRPAAGR
jgi:hypothetical protein